jgi:DNA polymerase
VTSSPPPPLADLIAYLGEIGFEDFYRRPAAPAAGAAAGGPAAIVETGERAALLEALGAEAGACTRCRLAEGRRTVVFGSGAVGSELMFIGEGPGAEEDKQGLPFVGRAGELLTKIIEAIELRRQEVYIANIVKCRPPGNRDPRPEEAASCRPYLDRQIELVAPTLIIAVGRIAAQTLLETDQPLGRLRGRVHELGERRWPVIVTYHPAYLLRSPGEKRKAWQDLLLARRSFRDLERARGAA